MSENFDSWPQQAAGETGKCSFYLSDPVQDGMDSLWGHQLSAAHAKPCSLSKRGTVDGFNPEPY